MARTIRRDNLRSRWLHRLMDLGVIWLALVLGYAIKEGFHIGKPTQPIDSTMVIHTFTAIGIIWLTVCRALDTYTFKRRLFPEVVNLVACLAVTIAFFMTYAYFTRLFDYPRTLTILHAVIGSVLLVASRGIKHTIQRALHRRGFGVRRAIIVGTGRIAARLADAFRENHSLGYQFIGYLQHEDSDKNETGETPIGSLPELERIVDETDAEEIIIALPGRHHQKILDIAHRCQDREIRLRVVPDLFEVVMIRATLTEIDDIPLIGLRDPVITGYQSLIKRCFDLIVATLCLICATPLFVIIPILIRLNSRGPVFFSQKRVGENGRVFNMYKFRSMVQNAEALLSKLVVIDELDQPAFKIKNDPRITRIGRFLRRTSLDELPQLFNVLKGDMSMVGPRPEELQVVHRYDLWHRRRLSIKPGITGPMQVSGRGVLPLDERIKLELMYISRYSILEDVKYLLKTIPAVCSGRGAY